jgi:hypothetical protein
MALLSWPKLKQVKLSTKVQWLCKGKSLGKRSVVFRGRAKVNVLVVPARQKWIQQKVVGGLSNWHSLIRRSCRGGYTQTVMGDDYGQANMTRSQKREKTSNRHPLIGQRGNVIPRRDGPTS